MKKKTPAKKRATAGGTHPRLMKRKPNNSVATPDGLFLPLHKMFNFTYDPCPMNFYEQGIAPDGLTERWGLSSFCNPPYSDIPPWVAWGAYQAELYGTKSVFLMPAHIETHYWHAYVWPYASEIWMCWSGVIFPGFGIKFPIPMAVVIYGHYDDLPPRKHNEVLVVGRYCFRVIILRQPPFNRLFYTRSALGQE